MAEILNLTVPIVPPSTTTYSVQALTLNFPAAVIQATLLGSDGALIVVGWEGAPATALMISLNKANLTTISLQKRVLQQAVTDGKLPAGNVTGTPLQGMDLDATRPDVQIKLMLGELMLTIANLEAQKAAVTIQVQTLTAQLAQMQKPEATD